MNDQDRYLLYRTRFIFDILATHGRTAFDSVADFGCGDGRMLCAMVKEAEAKRAIGIDFRAPVDRSTPQIEFAREDFFEFTPRDSYDLVTSIQVFEHIYEPWLPKYFDALGRSCRAGGTILISTPNRWRPSNIMRALSLRKPHMMNANPGIPAEQHLGHHRECSYRELSEIIGRFFPKPDWRFSISRPIPRQIGSTLRWTLNLGVYYALWWAWRPLCVSASHDHYVVVQRRCPPDENSQQASSLARSRSRPLPE